MTHARHQIREAVAGLLGASPSNWRQVVESRIASQRQIWPYLMVFAESDVPEKVNIDTPCIYRRTVSITVVGMLRLPGSGDTQSIEDKMDAMANEIETMVTNATLRAVAGMSQIESVSLGPATMDLAIDEENNVDHAELQMSFDVKYMVAEGAPETIL